MKCYQTNTYIQLKVDIYYKGTVKKQTKRIKFKKAYTLDFTLQSLLKGFNSDYNCRAYRLSICSAFFVQEKSTHKSTYSNNTTNHTSCYILF